MTHLDKLGSVGVLAGVVAQADGSGGFTDVLYTSVGKRRTGVGLVEMVPAETRNTVLLGAF